MEYKSSMELVTYIHDNILSLCVLVYYLGEEKCKEKEKKANPLYIVQASTKCVICFCLVSFIFASSCRADCKCKKIRFIINILTIALYNK